MYTCRSASTRNGEDYRQTKRGRCILFYPHFLHSLNICQDDRIEQKKRWLSHQLAILNGIEIESRGFSDRGKLTDDESDVNACRRKRALRRFE